MTVGPDGGVVTGAVLAGAEGEALATGADVGTGGGVKLCDGTADGDGDDDLGSGRGSVNDGGEYGRENGVNDGVTGTGT